MADQESARLLAGGAPRPVPSFMAPAGSTAPTGTPLPSPAQQPPAAQVASPAMPAAQVASPVMPAVQVAAPQVTPPQVTPPQAAAAHAPMPPLAGAYQDTPPGAQQPRPQQPQTFDRQAEQALHAVGGAMSSGLKELGSALDSFGKSLTKPKVGSRVLVAWSDGNRYPGTVAQVGQGQYLVTMGNGQQHWIPEAYVMPA
jgi:hypothetical protein